MSDSRCAPTDPVQSAIGSFGKWQLWICLSISVIKVPVAWHQLAIVFLAPPVDFRCSRTGTDDVSGDSRWGDCDLDNRTGPCLEWDYDRTVFQETIVTEWNLVCDKSQLANVAQTVFMFGVLLGNVLFGMAADRYGRKTPLVASIALGIAAGVATSFVPWFSVFLILRFVDALATGGQMVTSFVICMEIVSDKWRTVIAVVYHIPFNLGHLLLAGVSYSFRNWRDFQLAISVPSVLLLTYIWIIPESPRWLLAVGREKEAEVILQEAAKKNKLAPSGVAACLRAHAKQEEFSSPGPRATILDLFRTPNLRTKTLCVYYNWLVCGLCFFGLAQYMGQVGGNIFLNVAVSGLIELPGTFFCVHFMEKSGRRNTLAISQFTTGLACLLIMAMPLGQDAKEWPRIALSAVGIVGMSISFPTIYLFSGELFPTVVRNVGVGSASMCARIGSMVAPFVTSLDMLSIYLPPLVFGLVPVVGSLLCFLLPETVRTVLPDTIEEGENFGKRNKGSKRVNHRSASDHDPKMATEM